MKNSRMGAVAEAVVRAVGRATVRDVVVMVGGGT